MNFHLKSMNITFYFNFMYVSNIEINNEICSIDTRHFYKGKKKYLLSELIDFEYSHSYFNGLGGITFKIFLNTGKKLNFSSYHDLLFSTKNSKKRMQYNNQQIKYLIEMLSPYILYNFVSKKIEAIKTGKLVKVSHLTFNHRRVNIRPKTFLWLFEYSVPIKYAKIETRHRKIGIVGGRGQCNDLYLINIETKEEYRYSRNPGDQPSPSEVLKAQCLLAELQKV